MFPNLVASDDGSVFPKTESYLLIGGPKHGEYAEIPTDEQTWRIFAKSAPAPAANTFAFGGMGDFTPQTYMRRELSGQDNEGTNYTRAVFIHESVPSPDVAQQLLMSALVTNFVKAGRKVIEHDESAS